MRHTFTRRAFLAATAAAAVAGCGGGEVRNASIEGGGEYQPNWDSIRNHEAPEWFHDAKLGIFVHWGLYSVPAWATPVGELGTIDWTKWFRNNPYSEWYLNSLRIEGSPTQDHHLKTYGADFGYMDFAPQFNEAVQRWDPTAMASLFADAGARYVVLTTKHHDGFTLWPSDVENPHLPSDRRASSRDIVGELTSAVKAARMRMGFYYSGGLDWSFNTEPIDDLDEVWGTINHTREFADYADAHWRELIAKYDPAILWNDIGYPEQADLAGIVADFLQQPLRWADQQPLRDRQGGRPGQAPRLHHAEYARMDEITEEKWETWPGTGFLLRLQRGRDGRAHDRGGGTHSPAG